MKFRRILNILFFASLLCVLPSITVHETIDVFPERVMEKYLNLRSTRLSFDTKIDSFIFLNMSYVDPISKELSQLENVVGFQNSLEVNINKPGIYKLEFLSPEVGKIQISGKGGAQPITVLIAMIIIIIRVVFLINDNFIYYEL